MILFQEGIEQHENILTSELEKKMSEERGKEHKPVSCMKF